MTTNDDIRIPFSFLRHHKKLTPMAWLTFGVMNSLAEDGYYTGGWQTLCDTLGVSFQTVARCIAALVNVGVIGEPIRRFGMTSIYQITYNADYEDEISEHFQDRLVDELIAEGL